MRVSASLGLVLLLALFTTCEQRNFDRCLTTGTDYQCEVGKFCKAIPNDPNGIGLCVASECTPSMNPSGCTPDKPFCSAQGRCGACDLTNLTQCGSLFPSLPYCVGTTDTAMCVACSDKGGCESDPLHPACDSTAHTCRACALHSECASGACVKDNTLSGLPAGKALSMGMCVPKSRVIVVDDTTCAKASGCTLQSQIDKASVDFPYVLINTPTAYGQVTVKPISGLPELHIISGNADNSPAKMTEAKGVISYYSTGVGALTVAQGASVTVEGLIFVNNAIGVLCDSISAGVSAPTSVKLLRTVIGNSDTAIQTKAKCQLTLDQAWIGWGPAALNGVVGSGNYLAMNLDSTQFDIINSVVVHNSKLSPPTSGGITVTDSLNSAGHIVNSTFYDQQVATGSNNALAIYCPTARTTTPLTVFNTLFVNPAAPTATQVYVDPRCRATTSYGYVASDETSVPAGPGIVSGISSSLFNSAQSGSYDLRLAASAPASVVSGGVPMFNSTTAPAVDMLGTARNKTTPTMGAFEVMH